MKRARVALADAGDALAGLARERGAVLAEAGGGVSETGLDHAGEPGLPPAACGVAGRGGPGCLSGNGPLAAVILGRIAGRNAA